MVGEIGEMFHLEKWMVVLRGHTRKGQGKQSSASALQGML